MDDEAFWLRHLHLGLAEFSVGTLIALVYAAVSDTDRASMLLVAAAASAVSVLVVALLPHRAIIRSPRRDLFFYGWTVFSVTFVLGVVAADGGGGSPLSLLLLLPVTYSGMAYAPSAVAIVAVGAGSGYLAISALGPPAPAGMVTTLTGMLLSVGIAAAATARNREGLNRRLQDAARRDSLTGCLTHAVFQESVTRELARARRANRSTSAVMVDLDDFKTINDLEGHRAGDEKLRQVGEVLRGSLRPGDDAGRVGGDEFALLLTEADSRAASRAAERLIEVLGEAGIHVSVGVAEALGSDDAATLLDRADIALYAAKRGGKHRVAVA